MTDVIRRKIDRAQVPVAEGSPGADRGWRLALARAARDAMGLELEVQKLRVGRVSLAEIVDLAPDRALVALLDGPEAGLGVLMLSPEVTSALVEMQTLGQLSRQPAPPRRPSRIDAAMVAGVIDRALSGLDEALVDEADRIWAAGFRYASFLEEVRPLALLMEDESYRLLSADVALGAVQPTGPRTGQVLLVLPAEGRGEGPLSQAADRAAEVPPFSAALAEQVLQVDCRLDAVIGRLTLPLRQIMALEPGQELDLGPAALDAISVEALGGRRLAKARLGQHRGMRAVKLADAASWADSLPAAHPMPSDAGPAPPMDLQATG
jgi:flagellar motor switch protein FliM